MTNQEIFETATNKPFSEFENGLTNEDSIKLKSFLLNLPEKTQDEFLLFMIDYTPLYEDSIENLEKFKDLYPNVTEYLEKNKPDFALLGAKQRKDSFENFLASNEFIPNRIRIAELI